MQVDLSTHGGALSDAYKAVRDAPYSLNWALFGYDGKGLTLSVTSTGTEGLEELSEEFSDGKAQYAFARVIDDNTQLPKFVLINWIGEGVPENKKGIAASHVTAVQKFLAGFHVQINARSEKDVEPAAIMKKVRDSGGAKYSVQQKVGEKAAFVDKPEPVGARYEKPQIIGRQAPAAAAAAAPAPAPAAAAPKPAAPVVAPKAPAPAPAPAFKAPAPAFNAAAEEAKKKAEADAAAAAKKKAEADAKKKLEEEAAAAKKQAEEEAAAAAAAAAAAHAHAHAAHASGLSATVLYEYAAAEENELSLVVNDVISNIEQIDEGWWQGYDSQGKYGLFPSSYVQVIEAGAAAEAAAEPVHRAPEPEPEPEQHYYEEPAAAAAAATGDDQGVKAISLYDYQAADDNELSFDVNETITHIETIDDNWWRGCNAQGLYGLFPANYVELIQ